MQCLDATRQPCNAASESPRWRRTRLHAALTYSRRNCDNGATFARFMSSRREFTFPFVRLRKFHHRHARPLMDRPGGWSASPPPSPPRGHRHAHPTPDTARQNPQHRCAQRWHAASRTAEFDATGKRCRSAAARAAERAAAPHPLVVARGRRRRHCDAALRLHSGKRRRGRLFHASLRGTRGQGALSGDAAFGLPSSILPASFACARYSASLM